MKPKKAHIELYDYMKRRYDNKEQFTKADLMEIHSKFVVPNRRSYNERELTEEEIYRNASAWLDGAICSLIRRRYLGLTFRKNGSPQRISVKEYSIMEQLEGR